ncbi:9054_t:CDS:1, partial [Scutellospora calospora]
MLGHCPISISTICLKIQIVTGYCLIEVDVQWTISAGYCLISGNF